jgi:hypothetical protein
MSRFTDTVSRVVRYRVKRDFSQPRVGFIGNFWLAAGGAETCSVQPLSAPDENSPKVPIESVRGWRPLRERSIRVSRSAFMAPALLGTCSSSSPTSAGDLTPPGRPPILSVWTTCSTVCSISRSAALKPAGACWCSASPLRSSERRGGKQPTDHPWAV